jgi:hypothetical protein
VIGLVLISIGVDPKYTSVARSLSEWGPKGEPNASITIGSEVTESLKLEVDSMIGLIHDSYQGRAKL